MAAEKPLHEICPHVRFVGRQPKLSDVEKKLVCGDPGTDSWKKISLPQAREFLTAFLQHKGYHFPAFESQDQTLLVDIGTTTYVRKLTGSGLESVYDLGKRRKIVGQLLTPELLDTVKKSLVFEMQARGYACPRIAVTADARNGEIHADVDPGNAYALPDIPPAPAEKVDGGIFHRYEAFHSSQAFDNRMLSLTSERIKADALFASAYFDVDCSTSGMRITQRAVESPPHLVTIGVGADTEGSLQGRVRIQESRIGRRASSAEATIFASQREQSLEAFMRYYLRSDERLHLMPAAFIRRENEVQYEAAHSEASLSPVWTYDAERLRLETSGGPAVDFFNTIRGQGPQHSTWFQFVTRTRLQTHLYEYYQRDPRNGWAATLETAHRVAGADSDITAHWLRASGESLWNLGNYEPPLAVLATRGFLGTTLVNDRAHAFAKLPPTQRFFLGGDADLRGVDRKQLPNDGSGFLTAIYDGVELRAGDIIPYGFEPFIFMDAAMGSLRDFHLDPDVYYSPGLGLRWASPFGTLRATMGRGLTWRRGSPTEAPRPRWQFFFSFGKEF